MSKIKFTEEQQNQLRNNPYTARVSENTLSFTKEFKEVFYKRYISGEIPRAILWELGYPVGILGKGRIWGIAHSIKKEYETNGCFNDSMSPKPSAKKTEDLSADQQIRQLQQKLDYLTQEVEFLKKISSIRNMRK